MSFRELSVSDFLAQTAAKQPTPGGGAVAGLCGALAAALAQMVVSYSLGKKNLAEHQPMLVDAQQRLERARAMLLQLADEDAAAYGLLNELGKLPENDARRVREWPGAVAASVAVPMSVAACATDMLHLMASLTGRSNAYLRSDLAIAAVLADRRAIRRVECADQCAATARVAAGADASRCGCAGREVSHARERDRGEVPMIRGLWRVKRVGGIA
jgi:methenyltetrahydrofolate cyclohydrolase